MSPPLFRYGLDLTGNNSDNFVSNELQQLDNRRNRAVAPTYGAYFADSMVVIESTTGRILTRGTHFVPIELYQTLSLSTGKDIFGALLVIDKEVISPLSISYQCVGDEYSRSAQTLVDLLNKIPDDKLNYSWYDILNKPEVFNPTPHLHPIGEAVGFEYMVYALEKIRNAILWTDTPMYQNLLDYINAILNDLDDQMKYKMDSYLGPILIEFKKQLTKAFLGLGNVENLRTATEEEGKLAAQKDTRVSNFTERKYAALSTIVAFKNVLHETFVSSVDTNIGKTKGVKIPSLRQYYLNMVNGAIGIITPVTEVRNTGTNYDTDAYPTGSSEDDSFLIIKVTNNKDNRGGLFLAYQMQGTQAYLGVQMSGKIDDAIIWKRFTFTEDLDELIGRISAHITDFNNPHRVTKFQAGLGKVENLPVVTRAEVLCLDSVRKYVTFDALLLFIKAFMVGKNGGTADPRNTDGTPLENVQILYCPVSNCACEDNPATTPPPTGTTPPTTPPPTVSNDNTKLVSASLNSNKINVPVGDSATLTTNISGLAIGRSYNVELWSKTDSQGQFSRNYNTDIPNNITAPGYSSTFNFNFLNTDGNNAGQHILYVTIIDNTDSNNKINTNNTNLTLLANVTTTPPPTNGTSPPVTVPATTRTTAPPITTVNGQNITSITISPATTNMVFGSQAFSTISISGLIPGQTYNMDYYAGLAGAGFGSINGAGQIAHLLSFMANSQTQTLSFPHSNTDPGLVGNIQWYAVVTQASRPSNTRQSNTANLNLAAGVTTPPATQGPITRQIQKVVSYQYGGIVSTTSVSATFDPSTSKISISNHGENLGDNSKIYSLTSLSTGYWAQLEYGGTGIQGTTLANAGIFNSGDLIFGVTLFEGGG